MSVWCALGLFLSLVSIAADDLIALPIYEWLDSKAALSKKLSPGDTVELKLKDFQKEFQVRPPEGSSTLIDLGWSVRVKGEVLVASPLKSGRIQFPILIVTDAQGKAIGRTSMLNFSVEKIKEKKPEEIQKLLGPVELGYPWLRLGYWILGVLILIGLIVFILKKMSEKPQDQKPVETPKEPLLPPHQEAFQSLRLLEEKKYPHRAEFKKHYFELSHIVKHYISRRFDVDAEESTAKEIARLLKNRLEINEDQLKAIGELFERLDRVKFSDHIPGKEEPGDLILLAHQWIERTKQESLGDQNKGKVE